MEIEGKEIIERYIKWLQDNISIKNISNKTIAVDTPFLDRHNDYIRIYIKKVKEKSYYLTDDGYTFFDLETSGFNLTETKKKLFDIFINGQGIKFNENTQELYIESSWEELPQKKNDLIQAMINIGDMFITSMPYIKSIFFEEVLKFFQEKNIQATPDVIIQGMGYKEKVDFIIPPTKERKEKLIKLVNDPSRGFYKKFLFTFLDIKNANTSHSESDQILFINNTSKKVSESDIKAIRSYSVEPILWTEREEKINSFIS